MSVEKLRILEEGTLRHALPRLQRGISARTPERAIFEQFSSPGASRTPRSTSELIGSSRATATKHSFCDRVFEVIHWPLLLSFPLGETIQSKDPLVSTSTRFTKLLMACTTETSQKSMKSLPVGFMKDLSSKTVFASVWHRCREEGTGGDISRKWIMAVPLYLKRTANSRCVCPQTHPDMQTSV